MNVVLKRLAGDKAAHSIILLAFLIGIALSTSFYITPQVISDTDPSTYVIVPMLMLPLFALFMLKKDIRPDAAAKDVAFGILLFAAFLLAFAYTRVYFSYLFMAYRIDMLLFPVLMAAMISTIYGVKNVKHFSLLLVYALLASPALTAPLLALNKGFAVANTLVVYAIVKAFVPSALYLAPITIKANGYSVGIGETCAGIGVLISIFLFLGPLAYLYSGKRPRKWLWLFSGFALLLAFNLARMAGIAAEWIIGGPSSALSVVHLLAGVVLFYLSIIIMVLLAGRYGLSLGLRHESRKRRQGLQTKCAALWARGIAAAAMAILYVVATLNYAGAYRVSAYSMENYARFNASNQSMQDFIGGIASDKGFVVVTERMANSSSETIILSNRTFNATAPIALYIAPLYEGFPALSRNESLRGSMAFMSNNSITAYVYDIISNGTEFMVYHTALPYKIGTAYTVLNIFAIVPASEARGKACGSYNVLYSAVFNAVNMHLYSVSEDDAIESAYCMLGSVVRA